MHLINSVHIMYVLLTVGLRSTAIRSRPMSRPKLNSIHVLHGLLQLSRHAYILIQTYSCAAVQYEYPCTPWAAPTLQACTQVCSRAAPSLRSSAKLNALCLGQLVHEQHCEGRDDAPEEGKLRRGPTERRREHLPFMGRRRVMSMQMVPPRAAASTGKKSMERSAKPHRTVQVRVRVRIRVRVRTGKKNIERSARPHPTALPSAIPSER